MEPLATKYNKYGFEFNLVEREGLVAIYSQTDLDSGRLIGYEVFEVQQLKEGFVGPKKYYQPAREAVPNAESWGAKAFTVHTLEAAKQKMQYLLDRVEARKEKKSEV